MKITVVGAGVSGLSTAILLLQNGYDIEIIADKFSPSTTSDVAAAIWYPYLAEPQAKVNRWAKYTFKKLTALMKIHDTGIIKRKSIEAFKTKVKPPAWKDIVNINRDLPPELPDYYKDCYIFDSLIIDTGKYMNYLANLFKKLGGKSVKRKIRSINEIKSNIIVNCTGLGSIKLFSDKDMYPVRGQILIIENIKKDYAIFDDIGEKYISYIIPRINDVVLGGTVQKNNWDTTINHTDTKKILSNCEKLDHKFKRAKIKSIKVGLRPVRSQIRVELEMIQDKFIVHNYGHGGAGFTVSWGCAHEVLKLVKKTYVYSCL